MIHYKDARIQLLDLPGIIEGASEGKGRGRQVIAVAKSADLVMMVLDASKYERQRTPSLTRSLAPSLPCSLPRSLARSLTHSLAHSRRYEGHKEILTRELEAVGLRLNKRPPNVFFRKKLTGGGHVVTTVPLLNTDEKVRE